MTIVPTHRILSNGAVLTLVDSGEPGPALVIVAGQHGTEVAGILGVSRLLDHGALRIANGQLAILPCLNVPGFQLNQRNYPACPHTAHTLRETFGASGGFDLNRAWQPEPKGLLAEAWWVWCDMLGGCPDGLLDVHASRALANRYLVAQDSTWRTDVETIGYWLGAHPHHDPFLVSDTPAAEGSLTAAGYARGVRAMTVELHPDAAPTGTARMLMSLVHRVTGVRA